MTKNINMFLMFRINLKMKTMKDYYNLYLKRDVLLADVFEQFRNNSLKNYLLLEKKIES